MPLQQPISTIKAVSIGYVGGVARYENARLVMSLKLCQKYRSGLLPAKDVADTCWEAILPTAVDYADTCATWFWISVTCTVRFLGSLLIVKNARYVLVNFYECVLDFGLCTLYLDSC